MTHLGLNNLDRFDTETLGKNVFYLYCKKQNYLNYHGKEVNNFVVSYVLNYYKCVSTKFFTDETEMEEYFVKAKREIREILLFQEMELLKELRKNACSSIEKSKKIDEKLYNEIRDELSVLNVKMEPSKNGMPSSSVISLLDKTILELI